MPRERESAAVEAPPHRQCGLREPAKQFLDTLGIAPAYLDPKHDRCYCAACYKSSFPDSITDEGPTEYVVPRGWYRFALRVPPRANDPELAVFKKWSAGESGPGGSPPPLAVI